MWHGRQRLSRLHHSTSPSFSLFLFSTFIRCIMYIYIKCPIAHKLLLDIHQTKFKILNCAGCPFKKSEYKSIPYFRNPRKNQCLLCLLQSSIGLSLVTFSQKFNVSSTSAETQSVLFSSIEPQHLTHCKHSTNIC